MSDAYSLADELLDVGAPDAETQQRLVLLEEQERMQVTDYLWLDGLLSSVYSDPSTLDARTARALANMRLAVADEEEEEEVATLPLRAAWWLKETFHNTMAVSMILSALFITTILLSLALWTVPDWRPAAPVERVPSTEFVARISTWQQANFDETSNGSMKNRDLFDDDKIVLNSGLAVIEYDTGARVVLEGPATYHVNGRNGGDLRVGKLVARCETKASQGFAIEIPGARVVDLGTEFGVEVHADRPSVVAVVAGLVNVGSLNGSGTAAPMQLSQGQGAYVSRDGTTIARREYADLRGFVELSVRTAPPATFRVIPIPAGAGSEVVLTKDEFVGAVNCGLDSPTIEVGGVRFAGSVEAANGVEGIRIVSTAQKRTDGQRGDVWQAELGELFRHLDGSAYGESFDLTIAGLTPGERYRAQFIAGQALPIGQEEIRNFRISLGHRSSAVIAAAATGRHDVSSSAKSVIAEFTASEETVVFQLTPVDRRSRAVLAGVAVFRLVVP